MKKAMQFRQLQAILRNDFKSFVRKAFCTVSGDKFLDNWHIDVVCNEIEQMIRGENRRLIVNIPPRNLKSIICSVALPAYLLGKNSKTNIVCVSYSDDLTSQLADQFKMVIESDWYKELFPHTKIKSHGLDAIKTTAGGCRLATSINGSLTGLGGDWIIIDDPLKAGDGNSDKMRENVNAWYTNTLYSRLNNKNDGRILVVMQRLHESDLTGFLLSNTSEFKLVRMPMIAEENENWSFTDKFGHRHIITRAKGDLLHPKRENMDSVMEMCSMMGEFNFAGQYQQRPVPLDGGIVKRDWLNYYHEIPENLWQIIISWDTAAKTGEKNAYSACSVFGVCNGRTITGFDRKIVLLEVHRMKLDFPDLIEAVATYSCEMQKKYQELLKKQYVAIETIVEDASSGTQIIQFLASKGVSIKGIRPEKDKESRLTGITHLLRNGTVLLPNEQNADTVAFMDELLKFPNSTFKDMVDSFAQGVRHADDVYVSGRRGIF